MNASPGKDITIVVASINALATLHDSLAGFLAEAGERGDVVLVDASNDGTAEEAARAFPEVRVIRRLPGSLVPELWRDGLESNETPLVAFSTAQMRPNAGWLKTLCDGLEGSDAAGVGGSIAPGEGLSRTDQAMYLLRYANYLPPVPVSARFEPPGDNALYRRERLHGLEACWRRGFWEVDLHRRLRRRGEALATAPEATMTFLGHTDLVSSLRQRLAHARNYGAGRAEGRDWAYRFARLVVAPAVPWLLLLRIIRSLRRRNVALGPWLPAFPQLGLILVVWALGEALGACFGPPPSRSDREPLSLIRQPLET